MAIDPIAFSILGLDVRWYGLFYVIGFGFAYFFARVYRENFGISKDNLEDIFLWSLIASVVGGRLFYVVFYDPIYFLSNPQDIISVWQGGMSIHGGFFGAWMSFLYFSKKFKISFYNISDLFSLPAAIALAFGRFANYINQELVGKVTSSSIGVVFPLHDDQIRWPYQLFAGLKNLITFQILYFLFIFKNLKPGIITGLFLVLYNFGRFFVDIVREPTLSLGIISMGQLLCLVFGGIGVYILIKVLYYKESSSSHRKI